MASLRDRTVVDAVVGDLSTVGVGTVEHHVPTGSGEVVIEVSLSPTEELLAAAIAVTKHGLKLHWNGDAVVVIDPAASLPVEMHSETTGETVADGTEEEITPAAAEVARAAGLSPRELFDAGIGSGVKGRVTKVDIDRHLDRARL